MGDETNLDQAAHALPFRISLLGRLAVWVLLFLAIGFIFTIMSFPMPGLWAIGAVLCFEFGLYRLRKTNAHKALEKNLALHQELGALKKQEFELRYAEAKLNGQLDRFGETK